MRRSALALVASVIALALTAGPAAADPAAGQTVGDSTGSVQIGTVAVDAPVRVASDGDSATTGASAGGPQTIADSSGSAQVTSVDANAPVRVLSDGDDTEGAGSAGGTQSAGDSNGSAQVGAPEVDAPVRVASDGDNTTDAGPASSGREQSAERTTGSTQVGSPTAFAPVRVLRGGSPTPADESGTPDAARLAEDLLGTLLGSPSGVGDLVASPASVASAPRGGGTPSPDELRRLLDGSDPDPAIRFATGGIGDGTSAGAVQTLGVSAASLPVTGFGLLATVAMGVCMFATGLTLRLVPGGKRR
jgi:hypothetical protein